MSFSTAAHSSYSKKFGCMCSLGEDGRNVTGALWSQDKTNFALERLPPDFSEVVLKLTAARATDIISFLRKFLIKTMAKDETLQNC